MVERTVLDARCYVCGHLISGPVTLHTDKGRAHPSCVNCYDAPAELATLRARVEKAEQERDRWYSVAENAEAEAERNKELREEHARRRVHTEASWHEAVLDRDSWRSRAEAAEARLSEATRLAVEALEPFAVIAKDLAENHPSWDHDDFHFTTSGWPYTITAAPFRRARAALDRLTNIMGESDG